LKKIQKASIIQRLIRRFNLQSGSFNEEFSLSETVIPITNVDELLEAVKIDLQTPASVSATGWVLLATVPLGKKWTLVSFKARLSSGTYTFNAIGLEKEASINKVSVLESASSVTSLIYAPHTKLVLEQGDKIYVYVDAYTGTGNLQYQAVYYESDAF
jgi:hypothetical protein